MYRRLFFLAFVLFVMAPPAVQAQRQVALTFDDLPYAGPPRELARAVEATDGLLAVLAAHRAPASGFVTGTHAEVAGEAAARRALLRRWLEAGHRLENHGFSHLAYSKTEREAYLADVARGHAYVTALLNEGTGQQRVGFFRPPFNDLGESLATRAALRSQLRRDSVRLAPFTVEHSDYLFNQAYADALGRGDTATARRVGAAYLAQLDTAFAFAERLADDTFGRSIPQVFLLHANLINAHYLDAMLKRLAERGYTFVSLEAALQDPAYRTADTYLGRWGISWLHRWRHALGLENRLRDEPEPPAWLRDAGTD